MNELGGMAPIGHYEYPNYAVQSDVFRPWDKRAPVVAECVAAHIRERVADAAVEHIGSSAIPECDGKGVVDLLLMYEPGRLAEARDALDALGFQRQAGADPFPEERPMRVGTYDYDGDVFRLHVHVVEKDDPEAHEAIYFRDRLIREPALVQEYIASKRLSLQALRERLGDSAPNVAYNSGKEPFIRRILAGMDDPSVVR